MTLPGTPHPGLFISFEGIDGSGKSTQARLLADHLGQDALLTREPGGSPGAEEIRTLVLTGDPGRWSAETELLLFTAARRDHLERTIRPALAQGRTVITDRFADSTRVYQGATRGDLRARVDALHDLMIGTEPDLTFIIDMDPDVGLERSLDRLRPDRDAFSDTDRHDSDNAEARPRRALYRPSAAGVLGNLPARGVPAHLIESRFETFGIDLQTKVRAGFLRIAQNNPQRCHVIDGARSREIVATDIIDIVAMALAGRG